MPSHPSDATGNKSTEFPEAHETWLEYPIMEYETFILKEKNAELKRYAIHFYPHFN